MKAIRASRASRPLATSLALLLAAALVPAAAQARSTSVVPYPQSEVWPTAIRFLRIDRGASIREKDVDSGYVLFDLPEGGKAWKGSLELVRTTDPEGRDATRVVVTLNDLPRHFEGVLLDKLTIKLKEEYGSPAAPPPRKPPPAPPSEGGRKPGADAGVPKIPSGELPRPERR
jgi:hypothetical protein